MGSVRLWGEPCPWGWLLSHGWVQEVTGIYTNNFDAALNTRQGFPVFSTVLEANHVLKRQDSFAANKLTDEDREEILKLAKDPRIAQRVSAGAAATPPPEGPEPLFLQPGARTLQG